MIKGVNKRIVEIQNPDSLYFDKAIFYLKPNLSELSPRVLSAEAKQCLHRYSPRRAARHTLLRAAGILLPIFIAAGLGCAAGMFLHGG